MPGMAHLFAGVNLDKYSGAGVYNLHSKTRYNNLIIKENRAENRGGGMFNNNSTSALYNVFFTDNEAPLGAGIYNLYSSLQNVNNVQFINNIAIFGGGMYNKSSSPIINNGLFQENEANFGGGMYNAASSPIINNGLFKKNTANFGGGMYNAGSSPYITNTQFIQNKAYADGGGFFNEYSSPTLDGVIINLNTADNGGGLCNFQSSPKINKSLIHNNFATNDGGGLFKTDNSAPIFVNSEFTENHANKGGGIFNLLSKFELSDVAIENNTAFNQGGGIFMSDFGGLDIYNVKIINNFAGASGGGIFNLHDNFRLINVLLAENHTYQGGAVYIVSGTCDMLNVTVSQNSDDKSDMQTITSSDTLTIYNSIIYNNQTSVPKPNPLTTYYYSLIENVTVSGINNNLNGSTNPLFIDPANRIYQLDPGTPLTPTGSPCIDAGNNLYITLVGKQNSPDLAGNQRIVGVTIDMGAYEQDPNNPHWKSMGNNEDPLAIKEAPLENATNGLLTVSPNPTTGQLRITNYELRENTDIQILDVVGQVIFTSAVSPLSPETTIDLSRLANGMYFLKINNKTVKVVKH
jgi:predicted outer membrane repeat protein